MQFIDIPSEQTTAITDLILSVIGLTLSFLLVVLGRRTDMRKCSVWAAAIGLMGIAAGIGFFAHGFVWQDATKWLLWQPLNLSLGLSISMFVVGVVYDLNHYALNKWFLPGMLTLGLAFYSITLLFPKTFLIFVAYEALAMFFALGAYFYMRKTRGWPGAIWIVAGIGVSILAAGIQASKALSFTLIWEFDHNGIFHLVQMAGIVFIYLGVKAEVELRSKFTVRRG
ncbi:MAG: hypothetical protein H6581_03545 [Bacteroidia bacterium]|nr:hypothetical protein [Bacteroidia bacterium]